jgi:hypothetical protein
MPMVEVPPVEVVVRKATVIAAVIMDEAVTIAALDPAPPWAVEVASGMALIAIGARKVPRAGTGSCSEARSTTRSGKAAARTAAANGSTAAAASDPADMANATTAADMAAAPAAKSAAAAAMAAATAAKSTASTAAPMADEDHSAGTGVKAAETDRCGRRGSLNSGQEKHSPRQRGQGRHICSHDKSPLYVRTWPRDLLRAQRRS